MTIIEHDAGSELNIPKEGKYAIMFHLPGHCAGCKVALKTLEDKELKDITVELIDAGDENNRPLINEYSAQTAPTIIYFENGELTCRMDGLKAFISKQKEIFGD